MKHPRPRLAAFALLLTACASTTSPNTIGGGVGTPSASTAPRASKAAPSTSGIPVPGNTDGPVHTGEPSRVPAAFGDGGPVGSAAAAYLRAAPASRMIVEVDYVGGRRPSSAALNHVHGILQRETDKSSGVTISVDDEIPGVGSGGTWSLAQIRAAEKRHRDRHSAGSTVTMWVAYLDGVFAESSTALGVAYEATGTAIFMDQVRSAATALIQASEIEQAALVHEAGHLLGLVNLFVTNGHDQEDPDHPGHSKYDESVMFWAIEDVSISSILTGGPPDDFDDFDRDDLGAIRGS